ncbi:hypothetical protein NKR19_g5335 [Coniochaeta hoffmannii]|uniref:Chromo domain-containing protein n=1 Tax=Coniochaeta hoffmannii TaxID=91930 RepID=A0AA38S3X2_9PEZI|nr:hypothetical protein NKR19_g5335 [Coniochaeta hoffmannii]
MTEEKRKSPAASPSTQGSATKGLETAVTKQARPNPPATRTVVPQDNSDVRCIDAYVRDTSGEAVSAWFWCELSSPQSFVWRHETSLWHDRKKLVLAYWKRQHKNKRYGALGVEWTEPHYPHRIIDEQEPGRIWQRQYKVEWVGCEETPWLAEAVLVKHHKDLIRAWDEEKRERAEDDDDDDDDDGEEEEEEEGEEGSEEDGKEDQHEVDDGDEEEDD